MITSFFTTNLIIQTVVFVVTSCILMFFTRPLVNKFLKINKTETLPTNVYRLIGKTGIVVEDIEPLISGKVKVCGELWSATSDVSIPKNSQITVISVDGVKLKVIEKNN